MGKNDAKKGSKNKKGKNATPPIPEPPKAPYIPYDFSQPPKEKFSFDDLKHQPYDLSLRLHSKSTPAILPGYKRGDLCAIQSQGVKAFARDTSTDVPHVALWQYLSKDDLNTLESVRGNREECIGFLASKLPEEPNGVPAELLFELLYETVRFSSFANLSEKKTAALLSIVYLTHAWFKASLWRSAQETYEYMKEAFLLHTIQRPPKSAEIFDPEESRAALLYVCKMYERHLPLAQLTILPNYQLRMEWPPEPIPEEPQAKEGKGKGGGKKKK